MYRLQFGTADRSCTITTITSHTLYKETSPGWGFPRGRPLCSVWVSTVFSEPLPLVKHSNSGAAAKEKVGEAGAADPNVICDFAPTYNCSPLPTNDPGARAARSLAHHNQDPSTPGFLGKHEFLANVGLMLDHRRRRWSNLKPTLASLEITRDPALCHHSSDTWCGKDKQKLHCTTRLI